MKLKLFVLTILLFSSSLFSNVLPKLWAHGDIINPIELSSLLERSQVTIPAPDFLLEANWTAGDFGSGDTTDTYTVNHAKIVYLVYRDSAMTGTDSLWFGITNTLSNGLVLDAAVKVQAMNQTTATTFLSGAILVPGNNTTTIYVFTPINGAQETISGTFKLARLNVNDNVTPYLPKGRYLLSYE